MAIAPVASERIDTNRMLQVLTQYKRGDFSARMPANRSGIAAKVYDTLNEIIDQNQRLTAEIQRIGTVVGKAGDVRQRASLPGASGGWAQSIDALNTLVTDLVRPTTEVTRVIGDVAKGDLSQTMALEVEGRPLTGVFLRTANVVNTMVDQLGRFASEVTRVAREVGTDGQLGGQAVVKGVAGTWKDLTDSVNVMAANLTGQVRNIAEVTTAVARGDLSRKITVDVKGEILELKDTINTMVDRLSSFASEVTRVAREVGTEGRLGGQATVKGVAGVWKDLTENVNTLAGNLTVQLRDVSKVATAIAQGDLTQRITVDVRGEILQIKNVINTMLDRLTAFASEVTRVALEVGTEGKLGGQADVRGVAGTWKDLTDSVNLMASNLTSQVRSIAAVTTAVANGNLGNKITVNVRGEILELKNTINTMVDQLSSFASEVTRVAREVGTEGKLGGQAEVRGVGGTWKDLTDNVNAMASNLTSQVRNIAEVTTAVANGDLSKKITVDVRGEILEVKQTVNTMVDQLNEFAAEVTRVAREVGTEGRLGGQADVRGAAGTWKDLTDSVNFMASNLTNQVRNIATVTTAVANGDLSKQITVDVKGELLELKSTINTMVDQLGTFASEVTRVAREVGTEGKLGGQAVVKGAGGTWKDLTDNVNSMADNLTNQVRGIARVVTDVANGNLRRKLVLDARGEIEQLAETINSMIDTLATFADQVTDVAREVGIEGKLGGQARVPGAAGTWRDLVDNVNRLAANLTTQVRAIADVATAVTKGDLSRSIDVEALGEVAVLKDHINEMIHNLRDTTDKNRAQDWLKTNVARFTRLLQGQSDLTTVSRTILSELAPVVHAQHGVFYVKDNGGPDLTLLASYAYTERKHLANHFKPGEGLVGQCALERQPIVLTDVPGDYVQISSGLGEARPLTIVVLPVLFEGDVKAVIELASFHRFSEIQLSFLDQLTESLGIVLNTIAATMRTEELLKQSQSLAHELTVRQQELTETNARLEQHARSLQASEDRLRQQQDELQQTNEELEQQQEELQQTNEELEEKGRLLAEQNEDVESKNREIELARAAIEDKAEQLALTSKYKSEFLANMSHELRTPLNSLLILSKMLRENPDGNLTPKQMEFASTIHSSGSDLLGLIDEILDLAKIESGAMHMTIEPLLVTDVCDQLERTFRELATAKGLDFRVVIAPDVPPAIDTDGYRLQRILKNLLSNAVKFTDRGSVRLEIAVAHAGWTPESAALATAPRVLAFAVVDTGIGIPPEKHGVVFEAFQQVDGTTHRKFGGTGLGLSISRELARLLGGEIRLTSAVGQGSRFVLYLPQGDDVMAGFSRQFPSPAAVRGAFPDLPRTSVLSTIVDRALAPETADDRDLAPEIADDRALITAEDKVVLIVEEDQAFAPVLLEAARQQGFRGIVASHGAAAVSLAHRYRPDAITLDIQLKETDGWQVLDRLKHDAATRHIPVHILSVADERQRALRQGAFAQLTKPVTREALDATFTNIRAFIDRRVKKLLVVEDDDVERASIVELIGNHDVEVTAVATGQEALDAIEEHTFDCLVLDLGLLDMSGFELLEELRTEGRLAQLPVIVYTGRELSKREEHELRRVAETIIVKDAKSPDRLLDETALFLHRIQEHLPESKRRMLEQLRHADPVLSGKTVLIVDDDLRNTFALTSALEQYEMRVVQAENGRDGIETLKSHPGIDVVLMDIMMPELDGYDATRTIRALPQFRDLPIIALTAKAMTGDRDLCLEAGASDHITKPVDTDQLVSLLRVWLYR
jgi:CheY-like chemotaxis protein/signal transduction histidine kinase/HAMP domain-containing protein